MKVNLFLLLCSSPCTNINNINFLNSPSPEKHYTSWHFNDYNLWVNPFTTVGWHKRWEAPRPVCLELCITPRRKLGDFCFIFCHSKSQRSLADVCSTNGSQRAPAIWLVPCRVFLELPFSNVSWLNRTLMDEANKPIIDYVNPSAREQTHAYFQERQGEMLL